MVAQDTLFSSSFLAWKRLEIQVATPNDTSERKGFLGGLKVRGTELLTFPCRWSEETTLWTKMDVIQNPPYDLGFFRGHFENFPNTVVPSSSAFVIINCRLIRYHNHYQLINIERLLYLNAIIIPYHTLHTVYNPGNHMSNQIKSDASTLKA